jgi:hypothetical protein
MCASGNELWTRQYGTSGEDRAWGIAADGTGVYVGDRTDGALLGQSNAGSTDAYVRRYDPNGNEVWTRQFGTFGVDRVFDVAVDATDIYVVGTTDQALPGQSQAGGVDAYLRKYDLYGNELWTRQFGSSADDHTYEVIADPTGIYLVGRTLGVLPGQISQGAADAFIRKCDASGNEIGTRQFGGRAPSP